MSIRNQNFDELEIAFIIPCLNEELSISSVINEIKKQLPNANVFVCDNNSTDKTAEIASKCGAKIIYEKNEGKGNAVSKLFSYVDADIYFMVDGDNTYDLSKIKVHTNTFINEDLDMLVGARKSLDKDSYRLGHRFGNIMFTKIVNFLFKSKLNDIFSGYRIFSKKFVKSMPIISNEFEVETELSIYSLNLGLNICEVDVNYYSRMVGSSSKLKTFQDGFKIAIAMILLFIQTNPLKFFFFLSLFFFMTSIILAYPLFVDFIETGLVTRLPTGIVSSALMVLAFLALTCGISLRIVNIGQLQIKKILYNKN